MFSLAVSVLEEACHFTAGFDSVQILTVPPYQTIQSQVKEPSASVRNRSAESNLHGYGRGNAHGAVRYGREFNGLPSARLGSSVDCCSQKRGCLSCALFLTGIMDFALGITFPFAAT